MENCLVTKLKGVVDNDNLPRLGVWEFDVHEVESPNDATQWFNFIDSNEETIIAEIVGDGHFIFGESYSTGNNVGKVIEMKNPTHIVGLTGSGFAYMSNGNYKVRIKNKYNINILTSALCMDKVYLDDLKYSHITKYNDRNAALIGDIDVLKDIPSLTISSAGSDVYGTMEALMNPSREVLTAFTSGASSRTVLLTGDIASVINSPNLIRLDIGYNKGVYGDISYLGYCTQLNSLYVFNGTGVRGSIESMVAQFRAHGRTEGTLNSYIYGNKNVTFNGQPIPDDRQTAQLSWTASTITCNGVTIEA